MQAPEPADRERFTRIAIQLAVDSVAGGGGPFGAVIVREGRIVGRGQNRVTRELDPTAHAEIVAIREACQTLGTFSLSSCELYASCEPCPMCLGAVLWSRLEGIWYACDRFDAAHAGFDDGQFYEEMLKPAERRELPMTQLLKSEGITAFTAWNSSSTKTPY